MSVYAIIKIAGKGTRIKSAVPKQFVEIKGKPIFIYTLEKFQSSKSIDYICVVTDEEHIEEVKQTCYVFNITKAKYFVIGGATGNESTFNGFNSFIETFKSRDIVVSHDGVRPLTTPEMIDEVVDAIKNGAKMATPGIEPSGMILFENNHTKYIKREDVLELQTPTAINGEMFLRMKAFFEGLSNEFKTFFSGIDTIGFYLGCEMFVTKGSTLNFKITYDHDLKLFKALIEENS